MSEQTSESRRKGIKPNILLGAGAIAIVAGLVSGTYLAKTVYEPQVEIVAQLEEQANASPENTVEFYDDYRAEAFYEDEFFDSKTWNDYMAIVEKRNSHNETTELEMFDAQAEGVWVPGLVTRVEEARKTFIDRDDNEAFKHFMLVATATTLACDASGHDHTHGVDANGNSVEDVEAAHSDVKGHSLAEIAEDRKATQDFIANWSWDEEPMKYVVSLTPAELNETEQKTVRTAFTEAMHAGLPYYCPQSMK